MRTKKLQKDQVLGILSVLIALFFSYITLQFKTSEYIGDPGPKMFPLLGSLLLAVCGIALIVRPKQSKGQFLTRAQWKLAGTLFGIYLLNFLLLWLVGFTITVPVILFIITFLFSRASNSQTTLRASILKSLIYAAVVSIGIYCLYIVALEAQMPSGLIWKMMK